MSRRGIYQLLAYVEADVLALADAQAKSEGLTWSRWIARAIREQAKREREDHGRLFGGGA